MAEASVGKTWKAGSNLHDGLDSFKGFFTHMSNACSHVGHHFISLWSVQAFLWCHYTRLLQHVSPRVGGLLTCGSAPQRQMAFYHLALESHKCHFCSSRIAKYSECCPDSRGGGADTISQWRSVKKFVVIFENHHNEFIVIHLLIQPASI